MEEMKLKLPLLRQKLEEINNSKISLLELMVYDEIDCQLEENMTDEDFWKIFCKSINAYLKDDESRLDYIVRYCINNFEELDDLSSWEIVERC